MKTVEIYLKPSLKSTFEHLQIDENDDYNEDMILFQQGNDMDVIEIEAGEEFKISNKFEFGQLENYENIYRLIYIDDFETLENENLDVITFYPGKYKLLDDAVTFEQK